VIAPDALTLGLLAGGQGTRLAGANKAFLLRDGIPQVQRLARRFEREVGHMLVSANRDVERLAALGFHVVRDRVPDLGPIGGLDALASACTTPWLLTCPVDVVSVNDCLVQTLASAGGQGACVEDDDGVQPLVALWDVAALRQVFAQHPSFPRRRGALQPNGSTSRSADASASVGLGSRLRGNDVRSLHAALDMKTIRLAGVRFGNLNTPADLAAAGATLS
jgi:molybdopterin-guanine dinucleotide biosynthesis protein A